MSLDQALEELCSAGLLVSVRPQNAVVEKGRRLTDVTADSRKAALGSVFVAIFGTRQSGLNFAMDARRRGAAVVVADRPMKAIRGAVRIRVRDSAKALGILSAAFYGHPTECLRVYGVTGTNGKTTTTYLIRHLLNGLGCRTALIGTVQEEIPGRKPVEAALTTPDAHLLNGFFRRAIDAGCKGAACEISSHSLDQRRVWGIRFETVVFTNLTQDHLDYHKTMEAYFEAKKKLFRDYEYRKAVVNVDDPYGKILAAKLARQGQPLVTYGVSPRASVRIFPSRTDLRGSRFRLRLFGETLNIRLGLLGDYNMYNAAAAVAACATPDNMRQIPAILSRAGAPPGRMERVDARQPFVVLVDYAHTPDALEKLLRACRRLKPKRIISVFGCGGDRDRTKRPKMARVTTAWSDLTIATSDNPRTENPLAILGDIRPGLRGREGRDFIVEPDRRRAIRMACEMAGPRDLVVIAGKGHETYQIIGTTKFPFDDRQEARAAILERQREKGGC